MKQEYSEQSRSYLVARVNTGQELHVSRLGLSTTLSEERT